MKVICWITVSGLALTGISLRADPKPKKPRLEVRALPRMAFTPVTILLTAELIGGSDIEEYYCPEIEWDWNDGGKSTHEADCPPFEAGTKIERRFTAEHEYRRAGVYSIKVTMRRASHSLVATTVRVTVREGVGDPNRPDSTEPSEGLAKPRGSSGRVARPAVALEGRGGIAGFSLERIKRGLGQER